MESATFQFQHVNHLVSNYLDSSKKTSTFATLRKKEELKQLLRGAVSGLPRSWKSHGISGILTFSGISGKVIEVRLKLAKVMHEKVMEF